MRRFVCYLLVSAVFFTGLTACGGPRGRRAKKSEGKKSETVTQVVPQTGTNLPRVRKADDTRRSPRTEKRKRKKAKAKEMPQDYQPRAGFR
ncbi:MAG TPA: hypothetical protein VG095_03135 [Chthoniobacterales bacterium]|nr:hypothetical protein [Chthoniobacterales bacterium]